MCRTFSAESCPSLATQTGGTDGCDLTGWEAGDRGVVFTSETERGLGVRGAAAGLRGGGTEGPEGLIQQHRQPPSPAEQGGHRAKASPQRAGTGRRRSPGELGQRARAALGPQTTPGRHYVEHRPGGGSWRPTLQEHGGLGVLRAHLPGPSSPEGSSGRRLFLATSASAPKPRPTARPARERRGAGCWGGVCRRPSICEALSCSPIWLPAAALQRPSLTVPTF